MKLTHNRLIEIKASANEDPQGPPSTPLNGLPRCTLYVGGNDQGTQQLPIKMQELVIVSFPNTLSISEANQELLPHSFT